MQSDLQEIRTIVKDEVITAFDQIGRQTTREEIQAYFDTEGRQLIREEIEALENDVREIYKMLAVIQKAVFTDKQFAKLSLEQKLKTLHAEALSAAKQAGIILPGH